MNINNTKQYNFLPHETKGFILVEKNRMIFTPKWTLNMCNFFKKNFKNSYVDYIKLMLWKILFFLFFNMSFMFLPSCLFHVENQARLSVSCFILSGINDTCFLSPCTMYLQMWVLNIYIHIWHTCIFCCVIDPCINI